MISMTTQYQNTNNGTPKLDELFKSIDVKRPYFFEHEQNIKTEDNFTKVFGTGFDNIKYVEDFMTQEEVDEYMSFVNKYPELQGREHCYPLHLADNSLNNDPKYLEFCKRMGTKMIEKAKEEWQTPMSNLDNQHCMAVVHPTGTYLNPHTDILDIHYENNDPDHDEGMSYEEQRRTFPNLWSGHLAILAYPNDDFEGGYFYFPDFDYYFKPKARSILMFPGGLHYIHGVTPITKGTRYTLSQWCLFDIYKNPDAV